MTLALILTTDINVLALLLALAAVIGTKKPSLADRLESFFREHPGEWLNGHLLADCAGFAGWRSRVSDVRARGLRIENRLRHVEKHGHRFIVTEYRFLPADLLQIAESKVCSTTHVTSQETTC